jgi:DNA helicase-2/ATP-dependent DNA helicase PcrA
MLQLDYNIRRNAENPSKPTIAKDAIVELSVAPNQESESLYIAKTARTLLNENADSKLAILVRQRGPNTDLIIDTFEKNKIPYFFALFTDEDPSYVTFHTECLSQFMNLIKARERVTRSLGLSHIQRIKKRFNYGTSHLNDALITLLEIFWGKVFTDYSFMTNEEKTLLVKDTFEYNSLKQYIEFTSSNIIISTIHAAKGLEWDFVLLPDMEQNRFPGWYALCSKCVCRSDCRLLVSPEIEREFLEELSVFYVGVTRARRQVRFSASETSLDSQKNTRPCNLSCFLKLPGITAG